MARRMSDGAADFLPSPARLALITFLAIGGYLLAAEHWAHLFGYLPLTLLLAVCVGMHFFRHGSHGDGSSGGGDAHESGGPTEPGGKAQP